MRCIKTTRQSPWSEDPYIRGSYNIYIYIYIYERESERERENNSRVLKNTEIHQYKVKIQKIFFLKTTKKTKKKNTRKKESNNLFV